MSATTVLIHLLGGVALLLWGLRMVRTGLERAYGARLRLVLGRSLRRPAAALAAGLGITLLLQSSTATCLITASLAGRGLVATGAALAVMLGADIGTSLVAQVLSLNLGLLWPFLLFGGVVAFQAGRRKRTRDLGRMAVGLGLLLLALTLIVTDVEPMRQSATVQIVLRSLAGEPALAVLVAALLTWLAHSSLAVILLTASLAATGAVPLDAALPFVLGANLGGALPAIVATMMDPPAGRRVAVGNGLFKLAGVAAALPLLPVVMPWLAELGAAPARQVVNLHTGFNLALALAFLPLTGLVGRLLARLLPDRPAPAGEAGPRYLDRAALAEPGIALANAARETLRLGDIIDLMVRDSLEVFRTDDRDRLRAISQMDDTVDRLYGGIRGYLTEIRRRPLDEEDSRRCGEIMLFATNLEHIGDIIDKSLLALAAKKAKYGLAFSEEGFREIEELHQRVQRDLQLAMSVFVSGERDLARQLLHEKERFRELEREATESHHRRVESGLRESIETSSLHVDILRDLKRIISHIAAVAYPILEDAGELMPSRLRPPPAIV